MRKLISILFAIVAMFLSFAAQAESVEEDPVFVREITLSKGNWLWNHYMRTSASYRKAHPYKQFMETEACFLPDRKCTESDWRHVPRTQKIYIPAGENDTLIRVKEGASPPAVILSPVPGSPGLFALHLAPSIPVVSEIESELASKVDSLKRENSVLQIQYAASQRAYMIALIFAGLFFLCAMALAFLWRQDKKNAERATASPKSTQLIFKRYNKLDGRGYAVEVETRTTYTINPQTEGFEDQFKEDEVFNALVDQSKFTVLRVLLPFASENVSHPSPFPTT